MKKIGKIKKMANKKERIQELQERLYKKLEDYSCRYSIHSSTECGDKKINGKHITVSFPVKVKINFSEVVALFQEFYGDIKKVGKAKRFINGLTGRTYQSVELNLEEGY